MFPVQVRANIAKNRVEITFRAHFALLIEGEYPERHRWLSCGARIKHFDEIGYKKQSFETAGHASERIQTRLELQIVEEKCHSSSRSQFAL